MIRDDNQRPRLKSPAQNADQLGAMKNKLTKKEARAQREAYRLALAEGRVVRYRVDGFYSFQTFHTVADAEAFLVTAREADPQAVRLQVSK